MALFRRRLRAVRGWNELVSVIIDMQEVLELFADDVSRRIKAIYAAIPEIEQEEETGAVVLYDADCTAAKLNFIPDRPLKSATVIFNCPKDTVRNGGYLRMYQGTAIVGQLSTSAGTVTAANKMTCIVREYGGVFLNAYHAPTVSGTTANWGGYAVYNGIAVVGGIDKIVTTANMPTGAHITIIGEYMDGGE